MIDPELAAFVEMMPKFDLADPVAARAGFEAMLVEMARDLPEAEQLDIDDRSVPGWEGEPDVKVRVYRPKGRRPGAAPGPGVLLIHGGGFIVGSVETEHIGAAMMAVDTGAVVISVDYRLAPEHPYPAGLHDCYAALCALHDEAPALGSTRPRVAVVGASAGGGLAAATALLARDRGGPPLCFQVRTSPSSTTASRRRRCGRSRTLRCGTARWPSRAGGPTWALSGSTDVPATPRPPARRTCAGYRRRTSRPRRTTAARRGDRLRARAAPSRRLGGAAPVPGHLPRVCAGDERRRVAASPARGRVGAASGAGRGRRQRRSHLAAPPPDRSVQPLRQQDADGGGHGQRRGGDAEQAGPSHPGAQPDRAARNHRTHAREPVTKRFGPTFSPISRLNGCGGRRAASNDAAGRLLTRTLVSAPVAAAPQAPRCASRVAGPSQAASSVPSATADPSSPTSTGRPKYSRARRWRRRPGIRTPDVHSVDPVPSPRR